MRLALRWNEIMSNADETQRLTGLETERKRTTSLPIALRLCPEHWPPRCSLGTNNNRDPDGTEAPVDRLWVAKVILLALELAGPISAHPAN
jgi:hypothetical protein